MFMKSFSSITCIVFGKKIFFPFWHILHKCDGIITKFGFVIAYFTTDNQKTDGEILIQIIQSSFEKKYLTE